MRSPRNRCSHPCHCSCIQATDCCHELRGKESQRRKDCETAALEWMAAGGALPTPESRGVDETLAHMEVQTRDDPEDTSFGVVDSKSGEVKLHTTRLQMQMAVDAGAPGAGDKNC